MASKKNSHANEEPVGWVTIKGVHFPKWADGTIGWDQGQANVNDKGTMSTEELNKAELRRDELWDKEDKHKITKAEKKELDDLQQAISEHYAAKRKYESKKVKEVSKEAKAGYSNRDDQAAGEGSYTVSINRGVHGTERKTFKSAAEADKYVSDRVKAGDGSGSDYSIKYAAGDNKKIASMDLGNGLRLTADISDPYKNYSEVERAKKVNREKQYADKKLNQYRKAAQEEKAKAQAIADAISAKTGIANSGTKTTSKPATTSRNAKYDTGRATLTSKSSSQLKTMYKNASPEEQKKIASEMAVRGFYRKDGKWYSRGGGR